MCGIVKLNIKIPYKKDWRSIVTDYCKLTLVYRVFAVFCVAITGLYVATKMAAFLILAAIFAVSCLFIGKVRFGEMRD